MKRTFTLITGCLAAISVYAQGHFQKSYGGAFNEMYNYSSGMVHHTSDSGYVVCHSTLSHGLPSKHAIYFVRINKYGDTLFSRSYYLTEGSHCYGRAVRQTSDGGFIIFTDGSTPGMGLLKTDAMGNITWARTFTQYASGQHGTLLSNNEYLVVGGNPQATMVRADVNGNIVFSKKYYQPGSSSSNPTTLWSSYECMNGDIIATGAVSSQNINDRDIFILRTDAAGIVKFARKYGTSSHDEYGLGITEMKDRSIAVTGYCNDLALGNQDFPLLRTDSAGTLLSYERIGDAYHQQANTIICDANNYLLFAGVTTYTSGSSVIASGVIVKTYPHGPVVWSKRLNNIEYGAGLLATKDHGLVFTGTGDKFGTGLDNIVIIKTDSTVSTGCNIVAHAFPSAAVNAVEAAVTLTVPSFTTVLTPTYQVTKGSGINTQCASSPTVVTGVQQQEGSPLLSVFPNPAGSVLHVISENGQIEKVVVQNISGQQVMLSEQLRSAGASLDLSALQPGIYFLNIHTEAGFAVRKFLRE